MSALGAPPCAGCGVRTYSSCRQCTAWMCGTCLMTHDCTKPQALSYELEQILDEIEDYDDLPVMDETP